jgi:hypothetical protein
MSAVNGDAAARGRRALRSRRSASTGAARRAPLAPPARPQLSRQGARAAAAGWASFPGAEVGDLGARLERVVAPLDYQSLNAAIDVPTDENIARWIRAAARRARRRAVGIQSTAHSGVDLDRNDHAHLWRRYVFQAAHQLPACPPGTSADACTGTASR